MAEEFGLTKAQARQLEHATGATHGQGTGQGQGQGQGQGTGRACVHLSRSEVSTLYRLFKKLDFDSNGTLDCPELLAWIDEPVEIESFAARVFACR
jgi:hypothetical protein